MKDVINKTLHTLLKSHYKTLKGLHSFCEISSKINELPLKCQLKYDPNIFWEMRKQSIHNFVRSINNFNLYGNIANYIALSEILSSSYCPTCITLKSMFCPDQRCWTCCRTTYGRQENARASGLSRRR